MDAAPDARPGLIAAVKRLLRTVAAVIHNRLALLAVEVQEERGRLVAALLLLAVGLLGALLALVMISFLVVLVFWEQRSIAAGGLALFYGLVALGTLLTLRSRLKQWKPFSATLDELKKDRAWLEQKDSGN